MDTLSMTYDSTDRNEALVALGGAPLPTLTPKARTAIRLAAGCSKTDRCPVIVTRGSKPPRLLGESFYHETKGGTRIAHPSAYSKRGWSNMTYVASTLCVKVGLDTAAGEP
jgi:hypothetical protein